MTQEQFCYWLQGRIEMQPDNPPSPEEWKMIAEHLATVFHKITPPLTISPVRQWSPSIPPNTYTVECSTGIQGGHALATC